MAGQRSVGGRPALPVRRALLAGLLVAVLATACGGPEAVGTPTSPQPTDPATPSTSPTGDLPGTEPDAEATGTSAARPTPAPGGTPQPASPGEGTEAVEDGTFPAYFVSVGADQLTVDRIEILSGEEAAAARAEDGMPAAEEGVDIPYLRNRNQRVRTLPVAGDVAVQVYDCTTGCTLVEWSYDDLVAGTPLPYGGPTTPFTITVQGGQVTDIVEVYLP